MENQSTKMSKALKRKTLFMNLFEKPEGGMTIMDDQQCAYSCRACLMPSNSTTHKTESDWLIHLQSRRHQDAHKGLNLPRYLWDVDRTISITGIMGIHQREILAYLSHQRKINIIDFCYLTSKPGGVNNCQALLSSM